jgi:hypothetical protein
VSPKGVAEGGVPDRATFKPTSGAMVAALRWSSHCLCVALPILRVHQNLELFKRHGFLCCRFPFLLEFKTSAFGFFGGNQTSTK